ncbi:uncharacterized protein BKA55DRAFT_697204 [Fusarium redolens]|uniref:Uncharacterized protein n=1 Tax=Fusarium redolens TaxID=48865 RepID=A0A9P9JLI5_FUSRE|nr:uncharacterized protein BKA55DRAFT_697204 [Fusarium redolens]KAH7224368.1 hypothetical protein BKA55DRAFT_697204 [Fusarium redolens]
MVVEKGNKIFIPADQLTTTEVKVEWSKNWTDYSAQYYSVPFYNRDQGNEESVIFIQKTYLDSLKNKKVPGDDLTVIVDDSFQYGQNKEKTKRWLAYHDKKNEAYQWRFVEGLKSKLGQAALKFAGGFFPSIDLGMLKLLFGDYLRNF